MNKYILSCCSTVDLSPDHLEDRHIRYICFQYMLDGKPYYDDMGKTRPLSSFYQAMEQGAQTSTSQINVNGYINHFTPFLAEGRDVIHVCLSSGISGSFMSAMAAREELAQQFPERKIYVVDSLAASSGSGLLVDKMADLRDEGMDIDALYVWTEANKRKVQHWFFTTDLTYFVRGGRVTKAEGWFGTVLKICPLLNIDAEGKLIPRMKVRTKARVIGEIVKKMEQHAENGLDYDGKCFISHAACYDDARAVAALVEETFPKLMGKVALFDIGTTIGAHTGPGTVALFFWGDKRG